MDWEQVKTIAALWGAALSTILAIGKLLEPRPLISLESYKSEDGGYWYKLRIQNTARYPILLKSMDALGNDTSISSIYVSGWKTYDIVASAVDKKLNVFVRSGEKAIVEFVVEPDPPPHLWLFVRWVRHGGFPLPAFPKIIYRNKDSVTSMRRHPLAKSKEDDLDS